MSVVSTCESDPINKVRIAFVGSKCSGKTFAVDKLIERLGDLNLDISCQRISLRRILKTEFGHDGISTHETAHILQRNYTITKLCEEINEDRDVVIIEDIRYNEEIQFLKERGFKVACIETPWHIRLERLQQVHTNPLKLISEIQWLTHPTELDMSRLDGFDYVVNNELNIDNLIEKIIGSI